MMGDNSLIQPNFNNENDLLKHLRENMELDQANSRSEDPFCFVRTVSANSVFLSVINKAVGK